MMLWTGATNPNVEIQIQQSTSAIHFRLYKNTPVDRPDQFFKDDQPSNEDKIKLMYSPPGGGGMAQLIALERVFPILIDGTFGENHVYYITDDNGKIAGADFVVEVGVGGALECDQYNYLSLSTAFSDVKQLTIYSLDLPTITRVAYMYRFEILQGGQFKDINVANATQVVLPKQLNPVQLIYPDRTLNMDQVEPGVVSRVANNIQGFKSKEINRTVTVDGVNHSEFLGFENLETYSGDAFFNTLGTNGMTMIRAKSDYRTQVLVKTPVSFSPAVVSTTPAS